MTENSVYDYSFVTKDGIVYRTYFISVSYLHPSFVDAYTFIIEPIGDVDSTRHPIDQRIAITVVEILKRFFYKNQNSMLIACDNIDGKEHKRKMLFDRWYEYYHDDSLLKLDASLANEDYRLYVSMFINRQNPDIAALVAAFNDIIKTDLYELGI